MKLYKLHREAWERSLSRGDDVTASIPASYGNWYY